ncbi:Deacetylases, including yeast histone deacetylase and acetoin utilization protein [Olavius sp. associated proteobacterium Delta 1]|nr:Deacetylases, including yeast histone deacetylase and acetoin utilization protein [Olavius sp. associated proteobacterium Delta 1]
MKIFYTDTFKIPLPAKHGFPKNKYPLLRRRISEQLDNQAVEMSIPEPATDEEILRAHDLVYFRRFVSGEVTDKEVRRVGLPWSLQIVQRARYSVGATIAACRVSLDEGLAVNLGGGTHHAFSDHGQGYCWLNDSVIASRTIQAEGRAGKILIIDCDVHQGNGTAAILKDDPTIFTFSIHGKNNFPYHKETSDLDIELDDETDNETYLNALEKGLNESIPQSGAYLVIYLAGADPYRNDRFGRLSLTKAGLAQRDALVFQHCHRAGMPVAVTLAGGYAPQVQDTVDINFQTILTALEFQQRFCLSRSVSS